MHEYLNKPPQVGDIVVWAQLPMPHPNRTRNKPYLVLDVGHLSVKVLDDTGTFCYYGLFHGFKILKPNQTLFTLQLKDLHAFQTRSKNNLYGTNH